MNDNGENEGSLSGLVVGIDDINKKYQKYLTELKDMIDIDNLEKFSTYENIVSGFVLDFRLSNKTYFCMIEEFVNMVNNLDKKSFNEKDLYEWCNPIEIEKKKLKVNYRYDICKFLKDTQL